MGDTKRWKTWKAALGAVVIALVGVSCTDWQWWDDIFKRQPTNYLERGWTGGDGGISIPLGAPDRALWLFGDSYLTGYDPASNQRTWIGEPDDSRRLANVIFGTTIGLQLDADAMNGPAGAEPPSASQTSIWARRDGNAVTIDSFSDPWWDPGARIFHSPFFSHEFFGLERLAGADGAFLWPHGGHCMDCDDPDDNRLVLSFTEVQFCTSDADHPEPTDPQNDNPDCFALCLVLHNEPDCSKGVEVVSGSVIGQVGNVDAAPWQWTSLGAERLTDESFDTTQGNYFEDVEWGNSFVPHNGWVYIYGVRRLVGEPADAVVARARPDDVHRPSTWQYRTQGYTPAGCASGATPGAWVTGHPLPCALHEVADDVSPLYSLHKITRHGHTRFLLVHNLPGRNNLLHVRSSPGLLGFGDIDEDTVRLDLSTMDASVAGEIYMRSAGLCTPEVVSDTKDLELWESCAMTYHGRAHDHLSERDEDGIANLLFSYIVPNGPPGEIESAEYYRPRFGTIPIDHLEPFCNEVGVPCWRGIAHQFYARPTINGVWDLEWGFDVRRAGGTSIHASLTYGSGEPYMTLGFGAPRSNAPSCCQNGAGLGDVCNCTVPQDADTAWVRVSGNSSTSLRVHHQDSELGWTPWWDRDNASGTGDHETLNAFRNAGYQVCAHPTDVQCRRKSDKVDASRTGEVVECSPSVGARCVNAQQSDGWCHDYEVRFHCAPTAWLDRDNATGPGGASGDYETISAFLNQGQACDRPTHIECRRKSDGRDYRSTGERTVCDTTTGFYCRNADQSDGWCHDYEVRFYCGD